MKNVISQQDVAVLGLLLEHHHYAHRLQEIMEKRGMERWADVDYSSIPVTLEKLENNGLIKKEIRKDDVDNLKTDESTHEVYSITDNGRTVLINEIKSLLSKKAKIFHPFNLGLANIMFLSDDEIIESLESYLKSVEEQINYLKSSIKIQEENKIPVNFISISKRSLHILKAEKEWIKEFIKEL